MERKLWALSVYRAWAGLSQEELAEISGVGRNTISRLENGQQSARPSTAKKLADALPYGCTPKELMAGASAHLILFATATNAATGILIVVTGVQAAMLVISSEPDQSG